MALFVARVYRALAWTWRYEHVGRPPEVGQRDKIIYAHWHGDELVLVGAFQRRGQAIMASRSKDGELMKRVLLRLGFRVVRGSSTRGGAGGLKGLIDLVNKDGAEASLAVDGPRGPLYKVKPGVIKLAQQTGCPIIAGGTAAEKRFIFKKAWNKTYLPLPFSKCVIMYGNPFSVPRDADEAQLEILRQELEVIMHGLKRDAEKHFDRNFSAVSLTTPIHNGV